MTGSAWLDLVFEFVCHVCGHNFTAVEPDCGPVRCPHCGSADVEHVG